ncbi:MAG TPA: conjugal transfer protein TrbD [Bryobacteraceae bacterium]|jgi:type IV secretion system protein VirB3|nr:conjugal transfer protein TrbD [Bryobacteraceae bacterium]
MGDATRAREIPIHQSANRPNTLLGADREMVLLVIMIAFGIGLSLATWWGVVLAALFWVGAVGVLQRMGKADPLLRQVYMRHIRYEDWYPAKSGIYSTGAQPPMKWK